MRQFVFILASCLTLSSFAAPSAPLNLISKAVGQAGDHLVTSREVQLNFVMDAVETGKIKAIDPLPFQNEKFAPELVEVLKDWVVYLETQTFAGNDITQAEQDKLQLATRELIRKSSFFSALEFSDKEVRDAALRRLKVRRFVRFKRDSAAVPVSDADALRYFNENRVKFGNGNFTDFKDNIKTALNRQLVDQRLQDWFQILLKKYQARSFVQDL